MTENELRAAGRKIRLVVCDMDGTLLGGNKNLSDRNLEAIRAARRAGVAVTICSGRVYSMLDFYVRRLELNIPFISSNGAAVVDPVGGNILHQKPVPPNEAGRLFEFCARRGFDYCALGPSGGFFSPGGRCVDRFANYNRIAAEAGLKEIPLHVFDDDHENGLSHPIHKILIYRLSERDKAEAAAFLNECEALDYTFSEAELVDVAAKGVDKGYGVKWLARHLNCEKEEICVFGDYMNDLPMFGEAGLAVAMGNACEKVRSAADFVTAGNDEDGVAEALWKYILPEGRPG